MFRGIYYGIVVVLSDGALRYSMERAELDYCPLCIEMVAAGPLANFFPFHVLHHLIYKIPC